MTTRVNEGVEYDEQADQQLHGLKQANLSPGSIFPDESDSTESGLTVEAGPRDAVAGTYEGDIEMDLTASELIANEDPLRLYLREMSAVPMLTREGEVEIARRIERGRKRIVKAVSRSPIYVEALIDVGQCLRNNTTHIREVVSLNDFQEITEESLAERLSSTLDSIATLKKTYQRTQKLSDRAGNERANSKSARRLRRKLAQSRVQLSREARNVDINSDIRERLVRAVRDLSSCARSTKAGLEKTQRAVAANRGPAHERELKIQQRTAERQLV
ncbi:MAG TPA: sigma-70 factor domain-containing protein, partial [Candidatus Paceibacterota bacterium]|nr:sigma-70 factor domain-containing protein [Candidatus Paceibacterota bacterium]